jgi:phospholipase/carboxylesterase
MRKAKLGNLSCMIADPKGNAKPERIVILSHGFGAPGNDLVPVGDALLHLEPALGKDTQFIFPAAPMSLDSRGLYGGLAWWLIDLEARLLAIEAGQLDTFRNDLPEGMEEASDALLSTVEVALDQSGLDASRLIIGGFSQGSMVSTDVALRMKDRPKGLAVLSGTLLCEDRWKALAPHRGPLPVLQTHGRYDPILPYVGAEWLKALFEQSGFPVDFRSFDGMHEIPMTAIEGLVKLIGNEAKQS